MISVIVPTLNEAATVGNVVRFARAGRGVDEVIVVDDGSIDGTPELAREAGARVLTSSLLGKGASMADGVFAARNEFLVFLDGDLTGLAQDLVARLTEPLLSGQADFVKARFARRAGRVTMLTAKPLLRAFFPELAHYEQPLGGIIAARRSLLRRLKFENDYGVDIGLLLDVAATGAPMAEVDIGFVDHESRPLEALGDMAMQVVRTLLHRASCYGRLTMAHVHQVEEDERQQQDDLKFILRNVPPPRRLALLDMDGTLLNGRFIVNLARRVNRMRELEEYLDNPNLSAEDRSRRIAALFAGVPKSAFEDAAQAVPLMPGAVETVIGLRKAGYRVGIVSDGFRITTEVVRRRVFADFSIAHRMPFRNGRATGSLILSPAMVHDQGCFRHSYCKQNVLRHLQTYWGLDSDRVLAVGDGENDICLLRAAGTSIAFRPKSSAVRASADFVIDGDLSELLPLLEHCGERIPA
ncbi:MAG: HAD-IB family phosphatase [Gemmataceae bacterium]|nr:HAD-IB family phosphatase [Gemmataceae bacterium]